MKSKTITVPGIFYFIMKWPPSTKKFRNFTGSVLNSEALIRMKLSIIKRHKLPGLLQLILTLFLFLVLPAISFAQGNPKLDIYKMVDVDAPTPDSSYLDGIYEFIARTSPYYAQRTIERIINRGKQIATFPQSGVKVPEYNNPRIRQVLEGDYRIIYHIEPDKITVLTVIHGARDVFREE